MIDMKDIDEIRRTNIRAIEAEMGSASIAAKAIGMTLAQFINLRDGAKDSKTGKPRGMRKDTAWKIEDGARKPRGWLDANHDAQDFATMAPLAGKFFALPCTECGKVSHQSFIDLEMNDSIPCPSCGNAILVADYYGQSDLAEFLKSIGASGFVLRARNK